MDKAQARFILEGWMPDAPETGDPQVAAALAFARTDPELAAWLAHRVRLDQQIARVIADTPPPEALRATLLAGMQASLAAAEAAKSADDVSNPTPSTGEGSTAHGGGGAMPELPLTPGPRTAPAPVTTPAPIIAMEDQATTGAGNARRGLRLFRLAMAAGLAATLMLGATLGALRWSSLGNSPHLAGHGLAAFTAETLRYTQHIPRLSFRDSAPAELTAWLDHAGAPMPATLPASIADQPGVGCTTLDFNGHRVALFCFGKDRTYHLYIAPRDAMPDADVSSTPTLADLHGMGVATWADKDHIYVLNGPAPLPAITPPQA